MTTCSALRLNCFPWHTYAAFLAFAVVAPYVVYDRVATAAGWTRRREKSAGEHLETLLSAACAMTVVFVFGNYERTFGVVTAVAALAGVLGFAVLAEPDDARHTLADVHAWSDRMRKLVAAGALVVLCVGYHHATLAGDVSRGFLGSYAAAAIVPALAIASAACAARADGTTLHVHHLHVFLVLALFTRFPTAISRVSAGLFLGAAMHGAAAYGFDSSFER